MLIRNSNLSGNKTSWLCFLLAFLAAFLPLLNAWTGLAFTYASSAAPVLGGVIPWNDAAGYFSGGHHLVDVGYLDAWNMRRPLNALFYAFRTKVTGEDFWMTMLIQSFILFICLWVYFKSIKKYFGTYSLLPGYGLLFFYSFMFCHSTLSEALGLSFGLLAFCLLLEGWSVQNLKIFNAGMMVLAVGLCARAGPNFLPVFLIGLLFIKPLTSNRWKDALTALICFSVVFWLCTKLSVLYGSPEQGGAAFSNFGLHLYGLVNGGETWVFAYKDPNIAPLLSGLTEAEQAKLLYEKSWEIFKQNPLNLIWAMTKYLGGFIYFFIRFFIFGDGFIKYLTGALTAIVWGFFLFKLWKKIVSYPRYSYFLILSMLGIMLSASITWKDGGIRPFAVAMPFMTALIGFVLYREQAEQNSSKVLSWAPFAGAILLVGAAISVPYIPSHIPEFKGVLTPAEESEKMLFLSRNIQKHPHFVVSRKEVSPVKFKTLSEKRMRELAYIYGKTGEDVISALNQYPGQDIVFFYVYDYMTHSSKFLYGFSEALLKDFDWMKIKVKPLAENNVDTYEILGIESLEK